MTIYFRVLCFGSHFNDRMYNSPFDDDVKYTDLGEALKVAEKENKRNDGLFYGVVVEVQ